MELDMYLGPVAGSKIFLDPEFFFEKSANFAYFSLLSFFLNVFNSPTMDYDKWHWSRIA